MSSNFLSKFKHSPTKTGSDTSDWNSAEQSSEDLGREKLRPDSSALGFHRPRDISKIVDKAQNVHPDGFSGKLPESE